MNRVLTAIGTAVLCYAVAAGVAWSHGAPAPDLSGDWQFNSKAGQTPIVVDCRIRQTGTTLAGDCEPRADDSAPAPFTGSVTGAKARWAYGVTFRGNPGTVEFDTEVKSASRMTGTLKLNGKPGELSGEKLGIEARLQRLQDESEIRRRLQDYMPLLRNRDWDHYILMFSRDAEIVMDEGTRHGRDDIRNRMAAAGERMAKAAAGKPVRQSADLLSNVEVRVRGDIAAASSRFTFLAENDQNQFVVRGSGLYLDSWIREDGEWLIKRRKVVWDLLASPGATPAPAAGGKQP
jgi:3-phenylpropionate/cinnamic acid dioxygenase small subunit